MAVGYVALGMGYGAGAIRPEEAYRKAKDAGVKAVSIDSELGEAHAALAFLMFVHDFDWVNAEAAFERALELNPNSADRPDFYGVMLAAQERYDEAATAQRRAQELDPLTPWHTADLAATLLRAGRYEEALQEAKRVLKLEPHYRFGHATAGWALIKQGKHDDGVAELEKAKSTSPDDTALLAQLGQAYAISGRGEDAHTVLQKLEELSLERYVPPYHKAYVYTGLGEEELALDALEQSIEERAGGITASRARFCLRRCGRINDSKPCLGR